MNPDVVSAVLRLRLALIHRPFTVALAVILPIPGVLAVLYGDAVSAALTSISAGITSRVMGATLIAGGVLILYGLALGKSIAEGIGLLAVAAALATYGLGVILGLGLGGMVAGPISIAVAIGAALRVIGLASVAREVDNIGNSR